jgi:hypothetical protein
VLLLELSSDQRLRLADGHELAELSELVQIAADNAVR